MGEPNPEAQTLVAGDGYRLTYRVWPAAPPRRTTIVLLNGIMSNSTWFSPLAPALCAAGCTLVGADRRGSGPNEADWGDAPSAGQLVEDTLAIIAAERTEGEALLVLGWCWGAALAINVAAKLRGDLDGLVLVTPGMHSRPAMHAAIEAQRATIDAADPGDAVVLSPVREDWFTTGPALGAFIRADHSRVRTITPRLLEITRKLATGAMIRLRKLAAPTLVILAADDEATDNEAATRALKPYVTAMVTVDARHGVQFDAPDAVVRSLLMFRDQLPSKVDPE